MKNNGEKPIIEAKQQVVIQRPRVVVKVNESGLIEVKGNADPITILALLCEGAAVLARQAMEKNNKQEGSRIITPTMGLVKPS